MRGVNDINNATRTGIASRQRGYLSSQKNKEIQFKSNKIFYDFQENIKALKSLNTSENQPSNLSLIHPPKQTNYYWQLFHNTSKKIKKEPYKDEIMHAIITKARKTDISHIADKLAAFYFINPPKTKDEIHKLYEQFFHNLLLDKEQDAIFALEETPSKRTPNHIEQKFFNKFLYSPNKTTPDQATQLFYHFIRSEKEIPELKTIKQKAEQIIQTETPLKETASLINSIFLDIEYSSYGKLLKGKDQETVDKFVLQKENVLKEFYKNHNIESIELNHKLENLSLEKAVQIMLENYKNNIKVNLFEAYRKSLEEEYNKGI